MTTPTMLEDPNAQTAVSSTERAAMAGIASFVFGLLGFCCLVVFMIEHFDEGEDLMRGWSHPPRYELVRELEATKFQPRVTPRERGDFDGDGIDDVLDVTYLHRAFLFSESTSGMLYVHSGASGDVLLAHPVPTTFTSAQWCGDLDNDGRDDVWIDQPHPVTLFAFQSR